MADSPPVPPPSSSSGAGKVLGTLGVGCVVAVVAAVALPVGAWWWWDRHVAEQEALALAAQEQKVQGAAAPALEKLEAGAKATEPYDIDKTVRVIHEIDAAMESRQSMDDYLAYMATQDYRGVAPEVLEARRELLKVQAELYARQTEAEDQQASWEFTRELALQTLSVVKVSGEAGTVVPHGSFAVDSQQARRVLDDLAARQAEREALQQDIDALKDRLFDSMLSYSEVYYKYVDEWDRLCVQRDRAYLAANSGDWEVVEQAARQAVATAPDEREAHLLLALALLQKQQRPGPVVLSPDGVLTNAVSEDTAEAERILEAYVRAHPDASAPALLLLGVAAQRRGDDKAARLQFQQAAAYYPKQAEALTDMLDPYKMREWLRKSREGGYIIDLYGATMLGAGFFSPDLQLARQAFGDGDRAGGRQKVLDHFARRRSQQQWGLIIQDIEYAEALLGEDFRSIFPEDGYLDLVVKPTLLGDKLSVAVNNRSNRTLRNATLLLVVHFTDTHPGDYEAFAAERTLPAVLPREVTDFGTMEVKKELWGTTRSVQDIVQHRAILLTDEAVIWVDTDEFKIAEAKEFRQKPAEERAEGWRREMEGRLRQESGKLAGDAKVSVETHQLFADDVIVELPAELSIFKPVFTLRYLGQTFQADTNVIDGDHIQLRFKGVGSFDDKEGATASPMQLTMESVFGAVTMDWVPGGQASWSFGRATVQ